MKIFDTAVRMAAAAVLIGFACSVAAQQAYPAKPIRLILPFTPGGTVDPLARLIGGKLTESWGQPVVVENRPGGNTIVGTEAVAKSPADGYTLLVTPTAHVTNPLLLTAPYDAIKDFAPVATLIRTEFLLVVNPSIPANDLRDFIAFAKSKPGELNYASFGTGGLAHLGTELLSMTVGINMQHIPYKGTGPIVTDLIGGQIQVHFGPQSGIVPHVKTGKLKAIVISGEARSADLPQVPTFTEAGMPGFSVTAWYGILAPANTPKGIVDKLSAEIARILAMPDTRKNLASMGAGALISTPEQFAALMKADMAKYAKVIKTANIKIEQ